MKKRKPNTQEVLRRLGHMLALREMRGDQSPDFLKRQSTHEYLLKKYYNM